MNNPQLVMFDLDGTLAESKSTLSDHMAELLTKLLEEKKVAIISGAGLPQFLKQVTDRLPSDANLTRLYLMPTSGAALYAYSEDEWKEIYAERLSEEEAETIEAVIREAATETGFIDFSEHSWGDRVEYRGAQVTLSALGQEAPLEAKQEWDPTHAKRQVMVAFMMPRLPEYSIKIGGATSIDVTKKGINKAYGVQKLSEFTYTPVEEMLYVGDALFPGGNDEIVKETGIETEQVESPADTERIIQRLLES